MRYLFFIFFHILFFLTLSAKDFFIIYAGPGIHPKIAHILQKKIEVLMPQSTCAYVKTFKELNNILETVNNQQSCLVVPGGNTRILVEGFESTEEAHKTLENIRNHIKNGMSYLGICCGANWACNDCLPDDYSGSFYFKDKLLNLVPAKARWFSHSPSENGRFIPITHTKEEGSQTTYWNRGCYFDIANKDKLEVISSYGKCDTCLHQGKPCTLKKDYEKGKVVVTMIHPECDIETVESLFHLQEKGLNENEQRERDQKQKDYLKQLLDQLD